MTTLSDIIARIAEFDLDDTIYVAEPWTSESAAIVAREPDEGGVPEAAASKGLAYFLEVNLARQILWDESVHKQRALAAQEAVDRVICYAVNDA